MHPGIRNTLAVIAGFVAASAVMMAFEAVNGFVIYPELGAASAQVTTPEQMRALMATVPLGAMLVVLAGWIAGSIVGGWVAARIGVAGPARLGLSLGVLLTLAGIANNLMIPKPLWFWVLSLLVMLPAAWWGARLGVPRRAPAAA